MTTLCDDDGALPDAIEWMDGDDSNGELCQDRTPEMTLSLETKGVTTQDFYSFYE